MPEGSGVEALREFSRRSPASRVLMLTMHNDEGYLRMALAAGAAGYVLKQAANEELLSAIRVVSQGGTYLHDAHRAVLFDEPRQAQSPPEALESYNRLSPREKEILRLIALGYTNRQAAEELYISEKTIETYKARLMSKLNLHSRVELIRFAMQIGVIKG
jgi:two-component system response regulator NreC